MTTVLNSGQLMAIEKLRAGDRQKFGENGVFLIGVLPPPLLINNKYR